MMRPLRLAAGLLLLALPGLASPSEAPKEISIEFRGTLKDGLREIASQGGLNLVATGELSQPAEVYLKGVSAESALATVAAAYHLKVFRQGSIWTLRPMTPEEIAREQPSSPQEAPPPPAGPPVPPAVPEAATPMPEAPPPPAPPPSPAAMAEQQTREKILEKLKSKREHSGGNALVSTGPVEVAQGEVVDSAVSYGSTVTVKSGAVVEEDVVSFGGNVVLESGSVVEGDAVAFGGTVHKAEGARVEGDVVSFGGLSAVVAKGVTLGGRKDSDAPREEKSRSTRASGVGVSGFLLRFAMFFGLGFLALIFAPARMRLIEGEIRRDPLKCGLTGFLAAFILAVLTVLLVATLIGIPAALVLWTMVFLALAVGLAAVASELGLRIPLFKGTRSQAVVLAVGLLAMMLLAKVPILGPLGLMALTALALGAVIRTRFGQAAKGMPQPDSAE